jgi:DNA-binding NarL/FixJ family response regulator
MNCRILVVGAQPEVAGLCREALVDQPTSVWESQSAAEAKERLRSEGADVILAAETLSDESGPAFLSSARERRPTSVRILLVDAQNPKSLIEAVNSAEIFRFLVWPLTLEALRGTLLEALVIGRVAEAQEAVWLAAKQQQQAMESMPARGRAGLRIAEVISPPSVRWQVGPASAMEARPALGSLKPEHSERLSGRERQIVELLGAGQRVKDIAVIMAISTHTVRNHLKAIYRKLNVRSQFDLLSMLARA